MANLSIFNVGDNLLTWGLDMSCRKCVVRTKVVGKDKRGIVTYSDGCRILNTWDCMERYNDYFPYSVEKEREMQEECDNDYNAWREACRKQMERAERYHMERNAKLKTMVKEKGYFDGTHTIIELSGNSNFYRWKKYDILHINEELNLFGMADDGDTMFLNLDDLCVPTQIEIQKEIEKAA